MSAFESKQQAEYKADDLRGVPNAAKVSGYARQHLGIGEKASDRTPRKDP